MKSTGKAKQNKGKSELQASTLSVKDSHSETPAKVRRGFKRPPNPKLEEIIRLVNLLPSDAPERLETCEQANDLPAALRAYLDGVYDQAVEWGDPTDPWDVMVSDYREIVQARAALQHLIVEATTVPDDETIYFFEPIKAGGWLSIKNRTVEVELSEFARAIKGTEIDYLRYCQTCGNIFYAGRKNQQCCTVKCAKAQRQKRWRQRYRDGETGYYK